MTIHLTRTVRFYDSVTLDDLPRLCPRLFAYIDGGYENYTEARKRWPRRLIVPITVGVSGPEALTAAIIDCETGDADPELAVEWATAKLDNHQVPTIYRSEALWAPVDAAMTKHRLHYGIGPGKVQRFSAAYDGNKAIPPGNVAHQYAGSPGNSPGHYDETEALAHVPGWGMGAPLSRRHRRYAKALAKAWGARDRRLTNDRFLVELLERNATRLLDLQ